MGDMRTKLLVPSSIIRNMRYHKNFDFISGKVASWSNRKLTFFRIFSIRIMFIFD